MTSTSVPHPANVGLNSRSLGYSEEIIPLDEAIHRAREQAALSGAQIISPGTAIALTFLAKLIDAEAIAEIGTTSGQTGLAFFAGMSPKGILTSIDAEPQWQMQARDAFTAQGIPNRRFRLIAGVPLDVLPKLQDGAYDLVFVNGDKLEYVEYLAQALRLLRHGGVVVLNDVLWHNLTADDMNEDDETVILREAIQSVLETEEFTAVMLPIGNGLLAAVKQ